VTGLSVAEPVPAALRQAAPVGSPEALADPRRGGGPADGQAAGTGTVGTGRRSGAATDGADGPGAEPPAPGGRGGRGADGPGAGSPGRRLRAGVTLRALLAVAAAVPMAALLLVVGALVTKAWPAVRYNGLGFFTREAWRPGSFYANPVVSSGVAHPPGASYGALPLVVGTVESSLLALVVAVPVAIGVALVVVHRLSPRLSSAVGACLEVLAGVPSVVVGLWGALTLGPFLAHDVSPWVARAMPDVPVLGFFRGPVGSGEGLLTSGMVLAVMIVPIVAATARDLFRQVPRDTLEGAVALGMTDAEAVRAVSLRWVGPGLLGAVVLGLGRALGETMAVAMVSGTVLGTVPRSIYQTMTTIAATIVSQLDSALTDATGLAVRTLAEAGLVLVVITLAVNIVARLLVRRVASAALPVGRGL